ncbi:MAG: T9SS type A sorting domain-containing protein [Bacteroidales bacterium]
MKSSMPGFGSKIWSIKKTILIFAIVPVSLNIGICQEMTPAFPGAEGYAKYVTGGRGGGVVYVTHLKDNTDKWGAGYAGSFRAALETPGNHPITIIFQVGGVINPQATLECSRSNVTIAGQTALGAGICIRGVGINFSGNNIIVRYMRFRVGDEVLQNDPALTFSNGKKAIFDHCSFSWSTEENVNITDVDSVTLQWCINSESLYQSSHPKGNRGYAAQWGGMNSSYHHNLLAHHNSRMPRQNGCRNEDKKVTWDYRNNVHYNWGNNGAFYGGEVDLMDGFCHSNLINNYYKPGPATTTDKNSQYFCAPSLGKYNPPIFGHGLWYLDGNVMYDNPAKTNDNFSGLSGPEDHKAASAFEVFPINTTSAEEAYADVLANAGAILPVRDSIDLRIINEVKTRSTVFGGVYGVGKGIIDSHLNTKPSWAGPEWNAWGIYPAVSKLYAPKDTDTDGIPDWWESANGLNPSDTTDGRQFAPDGSGYTNLEIYLNSDDVGRTGPVSINNSDVLSYFEIFPNPVHSSFTIRSLLIPQTVEVYNLTGQKVVMENETGQRNINIGMIPSGYYLVKVTFSNGKYQICRILKN